MELLEDLADQRQCWYGLVDGAVGPVNAREIAMAVVARAKDEAAGERALDRDENVVTVDTEALTRRER